MPLMAPQRHLGLRNRQRYLICGVATTLRLGENSKKETILTLPRPRYTGESGMSTRRTIERRFLLRPDREVTECLGYLIGYLQQRYGFELHSAVFLSDHKHGQMTDPGTSRHHSQIANIERDFNSLAARAINRFRRRGENLWAGGGRTFNFVETPHPEDRIENMAYILNNVVEAELVDDHRKWPGLLLQPGPSGERTYRFKRPKFFFTANMPAETVVRVTAPKVAGLSPKSFMQLVYRRVNQLRDEVRARVRECGRRFLGAKGVLRQKVSQAAVTPDPIQAREPRYSTHDRYLRRELARRDEEWLDRYFASKEQFLDGRREVEFPFGTFALVYHYRANCQPRPPDWPY